jgi:hypothetical protein
MENFPPGQDGQTRIFQLRAVDKSAARSARAQSCPATNPFSTFVFAEGGGEAGRRGARQIGPIGKTRSGFQRLVGDVFCNDLFFALVEFDSALAAAPAIGLDRFESLGVHSLLLSLADAGAVGDVTASAQSASALAGSPKKVIALNSR